MKLPCHLFICLTTQKPSVQQNKLINWYEMLRCPKIALHDPVDFNSDINKATQHIKKIYPLKTELGK